MHLSIGHLQKQFHETEAPEQITFDVTVVIWLIVIYKLQTGESNLFIGIYEKLPGRSIMPQ